MNNETRISLGQGALDAHTRYGMDGDVPEIDCIDLIANVLHYAHYLGLDVDKIMRCASMHLNDEVDEEER